jgi:hypothetical protein
MQDDLISRTELLSGLASFTDEQRTARERFVELELLLPREWLRFDAWEVDASAAGRIATGIYNTLVESGRADPRFEHWDTWQMAASFADLLKNGGDALLWSLIRIGLEETSSEDLAELCESRGFMVRLPRRAGPA